MGQEPLSLILRTEGDVHEEKLIDWEGNVRWDVDWDVIGMLIWL